MVHALLFFVCVSACTSLCTSSCFNTITGVESLFFFTNILLSLVQLFALDQSSCYCRVFLVLLSRPHLYRYVLQCLSVCFWISLSLVFCMCCHSQHDIVWLGSFWLWYLLPAVTVLLNQNIMLFCIILIFHRCTLFMFTLTRKKTGY